MHAHQAFPGVVQRPRSPARSPERCNVLASVGLTVSCFLSSPALHLGQLGAQHSDRRTSQPGSLWPTAWCYTRTASARSTRRRADVLPLVDDWPCRPGAAIICRTVDVSRLLADRNLNRHTPADVIIGCRGA